MTYFDHAATSPPRREVVEAVLPYLTSDFGNAASQHELGQSAHRALEDARKRVAARLGARASEIIFTSGGTESDNTAVKGIALAVPRGRHVIISAIEHPAVLESAAFLERLGYDVTHLPVDHDGLVSVESLQAALRSDTTLVSVQYANNEVGTIQPIAELAAVTRAAGVPLHTDAVQAAGWLDLDVDRLGVQAMSLSGHKIGAPKGVGVLYVRRRTPIEPLLHGGGQERGLRSGTTDVASAVGFATALDLVDLAAAVEVTHRRDALIDQVLGQVEGASLTGHRTERLPGHASFVFDGVSGESVLLQLQERGSMCSSGSACAAGSDEPSPVLLAMGYDGPLAQTAIRLTFDERTPEADLVDVATQVEESVSAVRRLDRSSTIPPSLTLPRVE
ncbi:cysteine desulfurase family protein [Luteipulveratus mongoliensis]|uniref:Cysteine desulfurase n=1 Tax=Luteipulveratus mongoliensis TaxID=571913 RepID=A0A0K1JLU5_9MICO|nr:cysteine desulfurase family protein [Luteipulveratus mongoliensis]AKU17553.1 cysteine desulfurase [Luteipulveratus mongoliensis]